MSVLDTKSNRVTLKMDVSHTEHSHVIGKGGNNIKRVMEETGCHIHFPDSNRNNQAEKSNQVSIAGQPAGVEAARVKIRELLPLVLSFELPAIMQSDPSSPTVQHISQTYNLTVSFKPPTRLYRATGIIRGSQNNVNAVKVNDWCSSYSLCCLICNRERDSPTRSLCSTSRVTIGLFSGY
ncbi:Protein bicaudal C 1 [Ameca splendens]|uniref:Protein bicaudal C 1 n=1 Tax=Ameca splendens TaxID=208324 RepID=A0ABV0ZPK5_9TELE